MDARGETLPGEMKPSGAESSLEIPLSLLNQALKYGESETVRMRDSSPA